MSSPLIQAHLHAHGVVLRAHNGGQTFIHFRDEARTARHFPDRRDAAAETENARSWTARKPLLNPLAAALAAARPMK